MNKVIPPTMKLCVLDEDELNNIVREVLLSKDIEEVENELAITTSPLYRFYSTEKSTSYQDYQSFCCKYGFKCMNIINFEVKTRFIQARKYKEIKQGELPF